MTVETLLTILENEGFTANEMFSIIAYMLPHITTFEHYGVDKKFIIHHKVKIKRQLNRLKTEFNEQEKD